MIKSSALPDRQEFRAHQGAEFNAAVQVAAREGGFLLDVAQNGSEHAVATLHREQSRAVES